MIDFILYLFQDRIIAMWNDYGNLTFADITELSVTGECEVEVIYGEGHTKYENRDFTIYPTYFMTAKDKSEFAEEANYDLHDFMAELSNKDSNFSKFTISDLDKLDYPKELFLQTALQELFKQGCYENMQGIRL